MILILSLIGGICGLGSLICFIIVVVKMFSHGDTTFGILSIVLLPCGVGALIAFIRGWMKVAEFDIANIMYAWTGCFIGTIITQVLMAMLANA